MMNNRKRRLLTLTPHPLKVQYSLSSHTENKEIKNVKMWYRLRSQIASLPREDGYFLPQPPHTLSESGFRCLQHSESAIKAQRKGNSLLSRDCLPAPAPPVRLVPHQSFGRSGYHDCMLGSGVRKLSWAQVGG